MLSYIEKLIGLLGDGGGDIALFLRVFVEHFVKRHGKEVVGTAGSGYMGYLKLASWASNAARCAAKRVANNESPDCPHMVDPDHGLPIDI